MDLSIVCRDKQRVLTPQEFTEMTPEGVGALIHRSSKSVRDGGRQNSLQIESSQCNTVVPVPVKLKKKKKPPRAHLVSTDRKEHAPPQHKTPLVDVPSPAAAVMPDKSKVLELGPAAAIVSKNPTFKDIIAQSKCPIETYDTRVTRWFENPKVALAKADPTGKKDHDRLLRVHTFPLFLDYLIGTRYCITDECTNAVGKKSDLFCLIGELVNLKTNKADTGVLSIAVDEDHVCWHRAWAWMTTNNILNGIISGFLNKITNPTPAEANTRDKGMARSAMTKMDDIPVILDGADIITIPIDETHTLRLFPCDI